MANVEKRLIELTADVESVALNMMFLIDILDDDMIKADKIREELIRLKKRLPALENTLKELERKL